VGARSGQRWCFWPNNFFDEQSPQGHFSMKSILLRPGKNIKEKLKTYVSGNRLGLKKVEVEEEG